MKVLKQHIGRTCEVLGCNRAEGIEQHGKIEAINNGIASIRVHVITELDGRKIHNPEGWLFLVEARKNDNRVTQIH